MLEAAEDGADDEPDEQDAAEDDAAERGRDVPQQAGADAEHDHAHPPEPELEDERAGLVGVLGGQVDHLAGETAPRTPVPARFRWSVRLRTVRTRACDSARNRARYPAMNTHDEATATTTSTIVHRSSGAVDPAAMTSSMTFAIAHGRSTHAVPEMLRPMNPSATRPVWDRATNSR
nr:hypothetical protein GCM10025732_00370 [Glycomyces mayteni]